MNKTAKQIAHDVLDKLTQEKNFAIDLPEEVVTEYPALKGMGTVGGGLLGGLFGGSAGAGLGSSIRNFPGFKPTNAVSRLLSKTIHNPVGHGISYVLPFLGLGAGMYTGGRSGYRAFDVDKELTDEDIARILDASAQRIS